MEFIAAEASFFESLPTGANTTLVTGPDVDLLVSATDRLGEPPVLRPSSASREVSPVLGNLYTISSNRLALEHSNVFAVARPSPAYSQGLADRLGVDVLRPVHSFEDDRPLAAYGKQLASGILPVRISHSYDQLVVPPALLSPNVLARQARYLGRVAGSREFLARAFRSSTAPMGKLLVEAKRVIEEDEELDVEVLETDFMPETMVLLGFNPDWLPTRQDRLRAVGELVINHLRPLLPRIRELQAATAAPARTTPSARSATLQPFQGTPIYEDVRDYNNNGEPLPGPTWSRLGFVDAKGLSVELVAMGQLNPELLKPEYTYDPETNGLIWNESPRS